MAASPTIRQQFAQAPCVARIVFPHVAPDALPLRNVTSCALLRLADGTVRFLRLSRTHWTPAALDTVARGLAFADAARPSALLLKALSREVGDATLTLTNFALDGRDGEAWDLRRASHAFVAREAALAVSRATTGSPRERVDALERRWLAEIDASLAAFVAGLDAEACAIARAHGRFDTDLYNFLVHGARTAWRGQFVRTFPVLVHAAVGGGPDAFGACLREAVDAGTPLADLLARRWSVSRSAVAALRARPCTQPAGRWERAPHHLARILDAIRPEDRPRDDAHAWRRLDEAVAVAETIFRRPADACPLVLGWLRRAARRGFRSGVDDAHVGPEAIAAIDRLRAALAAHLAREATGEAPKDRAMSSALGGAVADRHLAAMPPARLGACARRYVAEYNQRRGRLDEALRRSGGLRFWPLLPGPLGSADGLHLVEPLTTLAALRDEGAAQWLCIEGGAELVDLAQACARGDSYVLSIRDASTGERRSTAEVRPVRRLGVRTAELRVHQHRARGNGPPAPGCVHALREALAVARSPTGAVHRDEGLRRARRLGADAGRPTPEADDRAMGEALAVALGEAVRRRLDEHVRALARTEQQER